MKRTSGVNKVIDCLDVDVNSYSGLAGDILQVDSGATGIQIVTPGSVIGPVIGSGTAGDVPVFSSSQPPIFTDSGVNIDSHQNITNVGSVVSATGQMLTLTSDTEMLMQETTGSNQIIMTGVLGTQMSSGGQIVLNAPVLHLNNYFMPALANSIPNQNLLIDGSNNVYFANSPNGNLVNVDMTSVDTYSIVDNYVNIINIQAGHTITLNLANPTVAPVGVQLVLMCGDASNAGAGSVSFTVTGGSSIVGTPNFQNDVIQLFYNTGTNWLCSTGLGP